MDKLSDALSAIGLILPLTFNYYDQQRLMKVMDDPDALKKEYNQICDEIDGVARMNLAINHPNFRSL